MSSPNHWRSRLRPCCYLIVAILISTLFNCLVTGELRGGEEIIESQPHGQAAPFSNFDDSNVVLGQLLYECPNEPSVNAVAACNDNQDLSRPDVPTLPAIVKTSTGEIFSVILTAQSRRVNFFSLHYSSPTPHLSLSPSLQLPSQFDPNATEVWTFNGGVPGPTLRAKVGDVLEIQLRNLLPVSTGLFIPGVFNAREPLEGGFVRPGQTRIFRIPLSMPGTFQYHSAVDAQRQVAMGLFGALVVTDDTNSSQDDQVIVISDSLMDSTTWDILHPLRTPVKRAEEQYNGRIGNVILVNGQSISSGPQLAMTSGAQHRLRFLNACSSRMLKITIPSLQFKIQSQWTGVELFEDVDAIVKSSFILPPGSTADVIIDIVDDMSGHIYEILATEITPTTERRRAQLKESSPSQPSASSEQPEGPIVSETWTVVGPTMKARVVELLLVPSNDGVVSSSGFTDSLDLPKVQTSPQLSDVAAQIPSCADPSHCPQPVWGFKTAAFTPQDAELVDVSLLFEAICPPNVDIPRIDIKLFGIVPEQLTDSTFHVPNSGAIFTAKAAEESPLAHSVIGCTEGRVETPVDLRHIHFNKFIQESLHGNGLDGRESLVWVRAEIVYTLPTDASDKQIAVATRAGSELPPPTLRLVYKTLDQSAGQSSRFHSTRPQDIKARRRRLERVFHEMQNEQQDMRVQLQTLYDRVKQKQQRQRLVTSPANTGAVNVVDDGAQNGRRLQQERQHDELVQELQEHLRQQEEQRGVERKLLNLQKSELPQQYKEQLVKELQHQLQVHYLKQQIHQQQLKRRLNDISQSTANSTNTVGSVITKGVIGMGGAFRGAPANNGALSFTEARALKQEKILYMRLYKQYNDLVGQMRHLKAASDSLNDVSNPGFGILPDREHHIVQFYRFVPLLFSDPLSHQLPQRILRLNIVQGLSAFSPDPIPSKHRHLMAEDIRRVTVAGPNGTAQAIWTDATNSRPIPSVTLTLGQSIEADFSGRVPMWIGTRVSFPDECPTELIPGTTIVWEIINQTPLTHTLYFHRVLLEIFERQTTTLSGEVTTQRVQNSNYNNNNGHFIGITIPAISASDSSHTVIRGVSKVPRLTGGIKTRDLRRWDIRVQSTVLEHISNGMTTRLHFNVVPVEDDIEGKGVPSGIDFSAMDTYDDDIEQASSMRVVAAAAFGGSIVVAAIASVRYYRNAGRSAFRSKRRASGAADELMGGDGYAVSQALEMTPTPSLDAGTPIVPNSFGPSFDGSGRIDHRQHDYDGMQQHHSSYRLPPYPQPMSPETSPEGVPQSYLQSPERNRRIKHRPGVATPGTALSTFNQQRLMTNAVQTPHRQPMSEPSHLE